MPSRETRRWMPASTASITAHVRHSIVPVSRPALRSPVSVSTPTTSGSPRPAPRTPTSYLPSPGRPFRLWSSRGAATTSRGLRLWPTCGRCLTPSSSTCRGQGTMSTRTSRSGSSPLCGRSCSTNPCLTPPMRDISRPTTTRARPRRRPPIQVGTASDAGWSEAGGLSAPCSSLSGAHPLEPARIHVVDEVDQAADVDLLVVVHRHVAALGTVQIAPALHRACHPLHVGRVHRVVLRTDDQRRHLDLAEI